MKQINSYILEKLKINKSSGSIVSYTLNDFKTDDICLLIKYNYKKFYCVIKVIKLIKVLPQSDYITYYYKSESPLIFGTDKLIRGNEKFDSENKYKYL